MTTTKQEPGRIRRAVLVVLMGLAVMAGLIATSATPAFAGEVSPGGTPSKYINGKCQAGRVDADCYHYAATVSSHAACLPKVSALTGIPKNIVILDAGPPYKCVPLPPTGHVEVQIFANFAQCSPSITWQQCMKKTGN